MRLEAGMFSKFASFARSGVDSGWDWAKAAQEASERAARLVGMADDAVAGAKKYAPIALLGGAGLYGLSHLLGGGSPVEKTSSVKHANVSSISRLLSDAVSNPLARDIRHLAVNPFLREQGEFMAGSGKALSDALARLSEYAGAPGVAQSMRASPVSDSAVALGAGGLGGLLGGKLLFGQD